MESSYGENIRVIIIGESHGEKLGARICGLPKGEVIDFDELRAFTKKRAPIANGYATKRQEDDEFEIISGFDNNVTNGEDIDIVIYNKDVDSSEYDKMKYIPRPSHSDYTSYIKYGQIFPGGGHLSGRLTAPITIAGGIFLQLLKKEGIDVFAHIYSIKDIKDTPFDLENVNRNKLKKLDDLDYPILNNKIKEQMLDIVKNAKEAGDSVGGVIECAILGMKPGVGAPLFRGIENQIASMIFGIPAVKGIEFGSGFAGSKLFGSENNDEFYIESDKVYTKTNNHGGILGGITSGMPITFKVAIKPTASIAKRQKTIDLEKKQNVEISITGRHDPCIALRATNIIRAGVAIAIYDSLRD